MQLQELRLNKKQGRPAKALFHFCGANFICFFPVPFEFFPPFPDTHLPLLILHIRPLSPTATEDFPVDIPVSVKYFHSIPVCQCYGIPDETWNSGEAGEKRPGTFRTEASGYGVSEYCTRKKDRDSNLL